MESYIEKRELLCNLAEIYLDTREKSYISINDGIMHTSDFDSISFLMLLALTFSKEEMNSIYSTDIEIPEDVRMCFIDREYSKVKRLKKDKPIMGKIILDDAKVIYESQYGENDYMKIDEIAKGFFM